MTTRIVPRRRGYTLVEMTITVGLMAMVGLAAAQLFRANLTACQRSRSAPLEAAKLDDAMATLRADVWGARELRMTGPIGAAVVGGTSADWHCDAGALVRTEAGGVRRWERVGDVRFAVDGPCLIVSFADAGRDPSASGRDWAGPPTRQVRLVSQVMLASGVGGRTP